jgi:hypothetical protein
MGVSMLYTSTVELYTLTAITNNLHYSHVFMYLKTN